MSAIVGFFHRNGQPAQPHWLARMMAAVAHRGVDSSGTWCEGSVAFGHQMMWITPESQQEKLPLVNRRGDLVITADARIDNRQELCDLLNISLVEAKHLPDSALILAAYEKWGIDCPKFLLGDFAFALWDARSSRLICVRDPMGVKLLHYYQTPEIFAFSTEAKGILALPGVVKQLNENKLANWLIGNFNNQLNIEETFFQNIHYVRPAHTLVIEAGRIAAYEYWQPDSWQPLPYKHDEEYLEAFRELFADTVKCRLRSAYPIGVLLSGGLDSSAIACVAAPQLREQDRELISVAGVLPENYQGIATDEREFVEAVCQQENLQPLYVSAAGKSPYADLERHFFYEESPIVWFYYLHDALQTALAQQQVRTVFHGVGAELGPSSHGKGYLPDLLKNLHWITLWQEINAVAQVQNRKRWRVFGGDVVLPLFSIQRKPYLLNQISPINPDFARELGLGNNLSRGTYLKDSAPVSMLEREIYAIKAVQGATSEIWYQHHLTWALPYFDIRLLAFCLAVPAHLKFRNGWNRNLIRIGMEGILPKKVQWRPDKVAFSPDYHSRLWKFGQEGLLLLDEIERDSLADRYLDIPRIRQMLYEYTQSPDPTYQKPILKPLTLQLFIHGGLIASQFLNWFEKFTPSVEV